MNSAKTDASGGSAAFFLILISFVGVYLWAAWVGVDVAWYSVKYWIPSDMVHVAPKPIDCNFLSRPVGAKGCSYEAVVSALDAKGTVVEGDLSGDSPPDREIKTVSVSWIKTFD
jgi:hypothetical protein